MDQRGAAPCLARVEVFQLDVTTRLTAKLRAFQESVVAQRTCVSVRVNDELLNG